MIINHNLPAINAHRQMGINNSNISKSLEKLSSGLGINRASDNAAGLAISEKMRGQISGLDQASKNAQDGISLIQTGEGALNETHSILQRMRELSVQSANGTYQDDVDRENIQKEVEALKSEVDRIATSTHYNNIKLLDGSLSGGKGLDAIGYDKTKILTDPTQANDAVKEVDTTAVFSERTLGTSTDYTITYKDAAGNDQTLTIDQDEFTGTTETDSGVKASTDLLGTLKNTALNDLFDMSAAAGTIVFTAKEGGTGKGSITSVTESVTTTATGVTAAPNSLAISKTAGVDAYTTINMGSFTSNNINATGANAGLDKFTINGHKFQVVAFDAAGVIKVDESKLDPDATALYVSTAAGAADEAVQLPDMAAISSKVKEVTGLDVSVASNAAGATGAGLFLKINTNGLKNANGEGGLTFQIGANGTKDQRVSLAVNDMSSKGIGVSNIDCSTQTGANKAIATIDTAINTVSGTRADLGALQNRMEHTINSLGVASENLTAAESRIRDVDMAKEMMAFTKNQILSQASQAMLAQANTLPQGVLQLLQ